MNSSWCPFQLGDEQSLPPTIWVYQWTKQTSKTKTDNDNKHRKVKENENRHSINQYMIPTTTTKKEKNKEKNKERNFGAGSLSLGHHVGVIHFGRSEGTVCTGYIPYGNIHVILSPEAQRWGLEWSVPEWGESSQTSALAMAWRRPARQCRGVRTGLES